MRFFFKHRQHTELEVHPEVKKMKKEMHKASRKATEEAEHLKETLIENGITFQIKIAAGGKK